MSGSSCICGRIRAAIEQHRAMGCDIRAIYLTKADWRALARCESRAFGMKLHPCAFDGHPLRTGKRSAVYSAQGVERAVRRAA